MFGAIVACKIKLLRLSSPLDWLLLRDPAFPWTAQDTLRNSTILVSKQETPFSVTEKGPFDSQASHFNEVMKP